MTTTVCRLSTHNERLMTDQTTTHLQFHEQTISLLSEIAIISNAMLAVFVVAAIAIIWTLHK